VAEQMRGRHAAISLIGIKFFPGKPAPLSVTECLVLIPFMEKNQDY
jgi:hypothetical protein